MIRTFYPVGQGAFYCEDFEGKFRIVYDCGSDNGAGFVENLLLQYFEKGTRIDALFLSHLHNDHVNGVEFLLNHCDVKNLFLPLLDDENTKIALVASHYINGNVDNSFIESLIIDRPEKIKGNTKVTYVPVYEYSEKTEHFDVNLEDFSSKTWPNGARLVSNKISEWVFVPFNFEHKRRVTLFQKELAKRNISIKSVDEFKKMWRMNKTQIVDSYRAIPGDMNQNSLVVYSGPVSSNYSYGCLSLRNFQYFIHKAGCIYFGDYCAKGIKEWQQFYNCYHSYMSNLGVVQIPHHGSSHSYNRLINKEIRGLSIISAGIKNRYKHPHVSVIKNITIAQSLPLVVTEDPDSKITCYIGIDSAVAFL